MKIFISYHRHSSGKVVGEVVKRLEKEKLKFWYDEYEIKPGDDLNKKMQEGILDSTHVIFFITKDYLNSKNCQLEFNYSQNQNKKYLNIF